MWADKECLCCAKTQPQTSFHKNKRRPDGYHYYCKTCCSTKQKKIYAANPSPVLAASRARYKADPDKCKAVARAWKAKFPERKKKRDKESHLKRRFGLTLEDFELLLDKQGRRCAICETSEPKGRHNIWQVDHDHSCCAGNRTCGKCVRGLLCYACNVGLGFFGSLKDLETAVFYISQNTIKLEQYKRGINELPVVRPS